MPDFITADPEVVEIAKDLIESYHKDLLDISLAVLMVTPTPQRGGRETFAYVKKVPADLVDLVEHDALLVVAADAWDELTHHQRQALIDHELCHLSTTDKGTVKMVDHEITEFHCVIERWGLWWPHAGRLEHALQPHLPFTSLHESSEAANGRVVTVDGEVLDRMAKALT